MEQSGTDHYDLIVIGGGPSGYAGAMRAIDFGKKVLLIEKTRLGGAGIYNGVLTSKTMWDQALKAASIRELIPDYEISFEAVSKVVNEAVFERKTQMTVHLHLLQKAKNRLLFYEKGTATLVDKNTVKITKDNNSKTVTANFILLATGSRPRVPFNIEADGQIIVTSDGIQNFTSFPGSIVVLGAGVIGCEFATIFSCFGKTKVNLIDKADRILPFEDEDIAEIIKHNLETYGAHVHHGASLKRMSVVNGKVEYELEYKNGSTEVLTVDKALISIGRIPNVENTGLENAGVKLNERGCIWDDDTQTNISNIFVAGDVTTEMALVNVGEREARHAVVRMFGPTIKPLS